MNSVAACTGGRFFVFLKCLWRGFRWKFSTTSRFILKQLDYSLSISMRDSWLGLNPRQLSRDRNLELIIYLFNRNTRESFGELEKTSFAFSQTSTCVFIEQLDYELEISLSFTKFYNKNQPGTQLSRHSSRPAFWSSGLPSDQTWAIRPSAFRRAFEHKQQRNSWLRRRSCNRMSYIAFLSLEGSKVSPCLLVGQKQILYRYNSRYLQRKIDIWGCRFQIYSLYFRTVRPTLAP